MSSAVLCAVMLTVAVDYGYEPMPGDGIRYVFRVEPHMLDVLRRGDPLVSAIPLEVRGRIHEFRMVSNNAPLSKDPPPLTEKPTGLGPSAPMPPGVSMQPSIGDWPPKVKPVADMFSQPKLLPAPDLDVIPASNDEPLAGPSGAVDKKEPEELDPSNAEPWFLLVLASVVAAGSSSGMLFFGWLAFDYRSRYLGLLRDSMRTGNSWLDVPFDTAGRQPLDSESGDAPASSAGADQQQAATPAGEDSAWKDLGAEADDPLDDWLNEDQELGRGSRRGRKKSR